MLHCGLFTLGMKLISNFIEHYQYTPVFHPGFVISQLTPNSQTEPEISRFSMRIQLPPPAGSDDRASGAIQRGTATHLCSLSSARKRNQSLILLR